MAVALLGGPVNVGLREDLRDLVKLRVRQLMTDILADRLFHAEAVAAGRPHWRQAFGKEFGAFFLANRSYCDELADVVYRFAEVQWRERYLTEGRPTFDGVSAQQFLDRVEIVSPPTEREIEDAWEVEIASDERAMRQHYEGSARVRKGADAFRGHKTPERRH